VPPMPISERRLDEANAVLQELKAGRIIGRAVLTP
jgi:D-arabinose 1-dehydrogenase-like Zn-dependent alcohol dehydrogenase